MLQELEEANAFVASLDAAAVLFRYHPPCSPTCCSWSCGATVAGRGVTALHEASGRVVRGARVAGGGDRSRARRRGTGGSPPGCSPITGPGPAAGEGRRRHVHVILAGFPADAVRGRCRAGHGGCVRMSWRRGRWEGRPSGYRAAWRSGDNWKGPAAGAQGRAGAGGRKLLARGWSRLLLARQRGDPPGGGPGGAAAAGPWPRAPDAAAAGLGEDPARAGADQTWASPRSGGPARGGSACTWKQGVVLAPPDRDGHTWNSPAWRTRRRFRPTSRFARAAERSRQAVELARRHGWTGRTARRPSPT